MATGLDRDQWLAVLEQIAGALDQSGSPIRLCLIGSVACVFGGMENLVYLKIVDSLSVDKQND